MPLSYFELFLHSSIPVKGVMIALGVASLVSWKTIIQKYIQVLPHSRMLQEFEDFYLKNRGSNEQTIRSLSNSKEDYKGFITYDAFLSVRDKIVENDSRFDTEEIKNLLLQNFQISMRKLENGVGSLATIASSAPFIGLFGTAWGVMSSFQAIADAKSTSLPLIASGISEALFTTAFGLFVALPAFMLYGKFMNAIDYLYSGSTIFFEDIAKIMSERLYSKK